MRDDRSTAACFRQRWFAVFAGSLAAAWLLVETQSWVGAGRPIKSSLAPPLSGHSVTRPARPDPPCRLTVIEQAAPEPIQITATVPLIDATDAIGVPRRGRIAGRVLDDRGRPVPGATVLTSRRLLFPDADNEAIAVVELGMIEIRSDGSRPSTTSNADGQFTLEGLDDGSFNVYSTAVGHGVTRVPEVAAGRTDLELRLPREASLVISAIDSTSKEPIPEPSVRAYRYAPYSDGEAQPFVSHPLDVRRLDVLHVRAVGAASTHNYVEVGAPGHGSIGLWVGGVAPACTGQHQIEVAPESRVSGRITYASGETVEEGSITLTPQWEEPPFGVDVMTPTDEEGRFDVGCLSAGTWVLAARAAGGPDETLGPFELEAGRTVADLQVEVVDIRRATVVGLLVDADGHPVAGEPVRIWPGPEKRTRQATCGNALSDATNQTDEEGRFRFSKRVGLYTLYARHGAVLTLDVRPGENRDIVLAMRRPPVLRGRVLSGGRPVAGATVVPKSGDTYQVRQHEPFLSDALGWYELIVPQEDDYEVTAWKDGVISARRTIEATWGGVTRADLVFGTGRLRGRVVEAGSGAHVANAWVRVTTATGEFVGTKHAAGDGSFEFEMLAEGDYRVDVEGADHPRQTLAAHVGESTEPVFLSLVRGGRIDITILGPPDRSANLQVRALPDTSHLGPQLALVKDGHAQFRGLGAATWRIVVSSTFLRLDSYHDPIELGEGAWFHQEWVRVSGSKTRKLVVAPP